MSSESQLEFLRRHSSIDCDTLDFHGPFVDCTSNQAIAYFEISKEHNGDIINRAAHFAHEQCSDQVRRVEYGVKSVMVLLSLRMLPYISGRVHTQSSLHAAYSRDETVRDALEVVDIYKRLSPGLSTDRICIKIPATYEGLEACRILEAQGINTLATTLFSVEQAILAHEVGCKYVAPYVNELKVHFVSEAVDHNKAFPVVEEIFKYYEAHQSKTRVLPASLVSTEEVLRLAGVHHITISPALLSDLSMTKVSGDFSAPYDAELARQTNPQKLTFLNDEKSFKRALAADTEATRKLEEAIQWFLKFEISMEGIMRTALKNLSDGEECN
ncbi:transaldolase [Gautieria morchelliformis]|nr:transaldolase [Gautieria morchelliformis]